MTEKANPIYVSSKDTAEHILDKYDNFLLDCDGVIWLDEHLIPGVVKFLNYLTVHNKKYTFVTNNSSKSRQQYIEKFKRLGLPDITKESIYPTCYSAALEVKRLNIPIGSKIWCLADDGVKHELEDMGYIALGVNDPKLNELNLESPILIPDPEVKAVVVGNTFSCNYMRIVSTLQYLLNKELPFIACNCDRTYPGPALPGQSTPVELAAGGFLVNTASWLSQRTDYIDTGKPSQIFLNLILEHNHYDRSKTIMVGDTLYTDIKFGNDGNLGDGQSSLLVLSGGTSLNGLKQVVAGKDESLIPSFYVKSLGELVDLVD
ncbi:uncharacterized protein KGF55_000918 [Candida pseudojiufengensis]|uniref:uncharacterized protein n=1 Tax=Candida pseudojiufengensis TaxID=497109 RepID=UPI002225A487|nr:uncharacterized protein KGF55_000918 [Candida pseudojiufengensis]KAI5965556.1 hypothetical protein KGF55_000918 [Candida pseudojiufengensis]